MELFEEIRREHGFEVGTIQGVARKLALPSAHPAVYRRAIRLSFPP